MKPCNNSPASRLWQLTFKNKILIILSCLFSVLSVATAFIPFISVYYIVYEIIISLADKHVLNNGLIIHYSWLLLRLHCRYFLISLHSASRILLRLKRFTI